MREQLNRGVVPDGIDVHCLAGLIKVLLFFLFKITLPFLSLYILRFIWSWIVGFWSGLLFESCLGEFNKYTNVNCFPFLTMGLSGGCIKEATKALTHYGNYIKEIISLIFMCFCSFIGLV